MPIIKKIKALNKKGLKRNKKVLGKISTTFKKATKKVKNRLKRK